MKTIALALGGLLLASLSHAESALTSRSTDLQAQAQSDAAAVEKLAEGTKVEVLSRKGAWTQVKTASGQTGWVRMMALKPDGISAKAAAGAAGGNPVGTLGNLLSAGRTSNTATVTTGVRGLSEEDLQNAAANPAELDKTQKYRVDRSSAESFAQRSKLVPAKIDYLPEPMNSTVTDDRIGVGG